MPENVDNKEITEIKQNDTLTKQEDDNIMQKLDSLTEKVNDFYLKIPPPKKEDPIFELFDKMDKERE
jgi:hypothetical protein